MKVGTVKQFREELARYLIDIQSIENDEIISYEINFHNHQTIMNDLVDDIVEKELISPEELDEHEIVEVVRSIPPEKVYRYFSDSMSEARYSDSYWNEYERYKIQYFFDILQEFFDEESND